MNPARALPAASAFFLPGPDGALFCLFHPPAAGVPQRGAFIYLHPFAEEMNCARGIAARQSRALAAFGFGVLQIDLTGCGDSAGEFSDASWAGWRADVLNGAEWLRKNGVERISLWGLRLGALLALDMSARLPAPPDYLLLWQPVLSGRQALTGLLRIALAGQALVAGAPRLRDTAAMRAALAGGEVLEIAGYPLAGKLAAELDALDAAQMPTPTARMLWLERAGEGASLPATSQRHLERWRESGATIAIEALDGDVFWNTPGHTAAPAFNAATARLLQR